MLRACAPADPGRLAAPGGETSEAPKGGLCDHPPMSHEHDHEHEHEHQHEHVHEAVDYADAILGYREDKDDFFRTHERSPIPASDRATFAGLPYFDVDEDLRFEDLTLEPYTGSEPTAFEIPTSDGKLRPATRAGVFRFEVDGRSSTLTAYRFANQAPGDSSVFVPFLDLTSGGDTYGAGRYLDLEAEDDGTYALDFNLAYHPSCVYDARFSCPLTPPENRLPMRIEAGERLATPG